METNDQNRRTCANIKALEECSIDIKVAKEHRKPALSCNPPRKTSKYVFKKLLLSLLVKKIKKNV